MLPSDPRGPARGQGEPSPWVVRWAPAIPAGGTVLDVACGAGRHTRYLLDRGHPVVAVDVDTSRVADLVDTSRVADLVDTSRVADVADTSRVARLPVEVVTADLESAPWPLAGRRFAGVVVTNYLWRPLFDDLAAALAPGGVLLYETFNGHGGPSNPAYHLRPGELLDAFGGALEVLGFEDADRQRLAARRREV